MKKTFEGKLYNRLEKLGKKNFNHIGCMGDSEKFINFLAKFVPKLGMQRKVKFTVESIEEPLVIEEYKESKTYSEEYD
jgi:hypothetical protein